MDSPTCAVCASPLTHLLYDSGDRGSLTSLARPHAGRTRVHACRACAHLQTEAIAGVDAFYESEYDILVDSEEEDQVYEVRDGRPVFRTQHQVDTLLTRLPLQGPLQLLDYGCAKSSTIRALLAERPHLQAHLFDVSERYLPYWRRLVEPDRWAVHRVPDAWSGRFDVVTSFFSLEHIPGVAATMATIAGLLRPGGHFYAIVPDVAGNLADFVVVDHCNHFTAPSLRRLLADAGLEPLEIEAGAHRGAFVIVARKPVAATTIALPDRAEVDAACRALETIAEYWNGAAERIREFERSLPADEPVAIYGAGFYGAFIAACLLHPERIVCHLDQNPYLQGRTLDGRPVLAPEALPAGIRTLLVGLNPAHARSIVEAIPALAAVAPHRLYL
jgi:SAM-dependent methyltransferase